MWMHFLIELHGSFALVECTRAFPGSLNEIGGRILSVII